jgi:hypothetical protein
MASMGLDIRRFRWPGRSREPAPIQVPYVSSMWPGAIKSSLNERLPVKLSPLW